MLAAAAEFGQSATAVSEEDAMEMRKEAAEAAVALVMVEEKRKSMIGKPEMMGSLSESWRLPKSPSG